MAWPTPQDYNEAIQNPQVAFTDAELCAGTPELNALQLPRAITGQFASVYKMKCGARMWAVRCFLRNVPNQQQRYEAISAHLANTKLPLPYIVDFEYQPKGIRVRGQFFPILKMAWVNGESLSRYIESNLSSPGLLGNLAYRWVEMLRALRRAGIAHGDLQHGNVLVRNDALTLVDYDGMFVPALSGQKSAETGHRNFQHPQRNEQHFGVEIDNFSAWVVYLSVHALRLQPTLWQKFGGGDECLLLRRRDFEAPEQSAVLSTLASIGDAHLRSVTNAFTTFLVNHADAGAIPPLDLKAHAAAVPTPLWLADHVADEVLQSNGSGVRDSGKVAWSLSTPPPPPKTSSAPTNASATALARPMPAPAPTPAPAPATATASTQIFFAHNPQRERWAVSATMLANLLIGASIAFGSVPLAMGASFAAALWLANLGLWYRNYWRDAVVVLREQVRADILLRERERRKLQRRVQQEERAYDKAQHKLTAPARTLEKQHERLKAEEQAEMDRLHKYTQARVAALEAQINTSTQRAIDAVQKSKAVGEAEMGKLQQQIGNLAYAESAELERRLRGRQEQFVLMALFKYAIEDVQLPGLTNALKARLRAVGIVTAADLNQLVVLAEVAPEHKVALTKWREYLEAQARAVAPNTLLPADEQVVRTAFARRRRQLQDELQRWQTRLRAEEDAFWARSQAQQDALQKKIVQVRQSAIQAETQLRDRYTQRSVKLGTEIARTRQDIAPQLQNAEQKLTNSQSKLTAVQTEQERLQALLQNEYGAVRFSNYVRWILFGYSANS